MFFLRLEHGFDLGELSFQFDVLGVLDYEWWVADYGAQELFLRYLFKVGEAEFGEEFLKDVL